MRPFQTLCLLTMVEPIDQYTIPDEGIFLHIKLGEV